MEIRAGTACDLAQVQEIWHQCFGNDTFSTWFFERLYETKHLRVLTIDGVVVSMAFCFPREIESENVMCKAWYFYGIGTHPSARGKGYARKLIEACIAEARERDVDLCFLIPAEQSLFSYYKRIGFSKIWTRDVTLTHADVPRMKLEIASVKPDEIAILNRLYEEMIENRVCRSAHDWKLILEEFRISQGDAVLLYENKNLIGYAFFYEKEDVLHIRELALCNRVEPNDVCHAMCRKKRWELTRVGDQNDFAMAYPLSKRGEGCTNVYCDLLYN